MQKAAALNDQMQIASQIKAVKKALEVEGAQVGSLSEFLLANGYPGSLQDYIPDDFENEQPTDEARTNEDPYDDIQQQMATTKYGEFMPKKGNATVGNCVFLREGKNIQKDSDYSSGEGEENEDDDSEEEGEFDPSMVPG